MQHGGRMIARAIALAAVLAAVAPVAQRRLAARDVGRRLDGLAGATWPGGAPVPGAARAVQLASWQTIGGCGAGASAGAGGGIKWIGRNVRGGLFRIECQANYVHTPYGYNYVGNTLLSADVGDKWNLGVSVPYLHKYMNDPYGQGFDVMNRGLGDVNLQVTRKLGTIDATAATISVGLPTGKHDATLVRDPNVILPQDRQLGLGKPTATFILDHTIDNLWGPMVLGGLATWRGGENDLGSYRAPSAALYGYVSRLLGPFAPSLGVQVTGFARRDRDQGAEQTDAPVVSVAGNLSLEWAGDWAAILFGASLPYDYKGAADDPSGRPRSAWGFGAWTVAVGLALAPF
jgi:hypothetical protein